MAMRRDRMVEQKLKIQVQGCIQANEAEINWAVEEALANLMALVERGDMEFDGPEDMAHVAEQMIRASMDRMGIVDFVGLSSPVSVANKAVERGAAEPLVTTSESGSEGYF